MTDDLVERLDKRADALRRYYPGMHWTIKDVEAAADEIKRLREALKRVICQYEHEVNPNKALFNIEEIASNALGRVHDR